MIVAGFGFRAGVGLDSLRAALTLACEGVGPDLLATAAGKEHNAALRALADEMGLRIHPVMPERLIAQMTFTQSQASQTAHGTGSVAEAAALAAAGRNARLIAARHISPNRMATCAMAEGDGH